MKKIIIFLMLFFPIVCLAASANEILINEVAWMGSTISANDEWFELYNNTQNEIDLTNWILQANDGSPKIILSGKISTQNYYLLERTDDETVPNVSADLIYSGSLSNDGEWLKLFDSDNNLINEINAQSGWPGGENETKKTLERVNQTWQTSSLINGTPKSQNSIQDNETTSTPEIINDNTIEADEVGAPSIANNNLIVEINKGDLIINEVLPNPIGPDDQNEFIEIKNVSNKNINLDGYYLKTANQQKYTLGPTVLFSNNYLTLFRSQTNLALNNNKEKIILYSPNNKIINEVSLTSAEAEGKSFQKNYNPENSNKFCWDQPTPSQDNYCNYLILPTVIINGPKTAQINEFLTFDGSDSFDPKNRNLKYIWSFGDGRIAQGIIAYQIYLQPGNYDISLKAIIDEIASSTEILKIKVSAKDSENNKLKSTSTPATENQLFLSTSTEKFNFKNFPNIFISEFLPDPKEDEANNEFIELYSNEDYPVNLGGFYLDDSENKNRPYKIPENTIIKPGQYLAFFRQQTKIALNNDIDEVRLLSPKNEAIDLAKYEKAKTNVSFILDENFSWQPSLTPTPGEINVINQPEEKSEIKPSSTPKILGAQNSIEQNNQESNSIQDNKNYIRYIFALVAGLMAIALVIFYKYKKTID